MTNKQALKNLCKTITGKESTGNTISEIINDIDNNYPVETPTVSSIAITTEPTKKAYTEGETFDPTGMVVTATYSDDTTKPVTDYTYSPNTALATTDTTITVTYEGKTANQTITVSATQEAQLGN